jgi:hypothetical protein
MGAFLSPQSVALAWLVGGLVISAAETLAPGTFLVFIGAAAAVVGAVAYFFPLDLTHQVLLFGAVVVASVLIGRDVYGSFLAYPVALAERGVAVSYETVRRWVDHFGPMIAADLRKRRRRVVQRCVFLVSAWWGRANCHEPLGCWRLEDRSWGGRRDSGRISNGF